MSSEETRPSAPCSSHGSAPEVNDGESDMAVNKRDNPRLVGITPSRPRRCYEYPMRLLYGRDIETADGVKRQAWMVDSADWEWLCGQYDNQMPPGPYTNDQIAIWSAQILANRS